MKPDALENRRESSNDKVLITDPYLFKDLMQEIQDTVLLESYIDSTGAEHFAHLNIEKQGTIGFEMDGDIRLRANQINHRRNRLLHKLVRIQKEFQFAQKHLKNYQSLTPREIEIVILLAKGLNNPAIAQKLFISRSTVEQHRKHINQKLEVRSLVHLFRYAHAFDLI